MLVTRPQLSNGAITRWVRRDQPLARTGYYSLTDGQKLTQEFLAAALPEEGVDAEMPWARNECHRIVTCECLIFDVFLSY